LRKKKAFVFETRHEKFPEDFDGLTAEQKREREEKTSEKLIARAKEKIAREDLAGKHLSGYDFA
jgi:hypothetical protein